MISGFNTDIEFQGTVYHVQTEDKGLQKRMIMSLVYDRGTILASKRASYDDLEAGSFDEKELTARLSRQHKLICAAVKAGRIGHGGMVRREEPGKVRENTIRERITLCPPRRPSITSDTTHSETTRVSGSRKISIRSRS